MTQLAFNEQFYLSQNPDVVTAIARGQFANAQQHFNTFGRTEGRDPNAFFDTSFYLTQYPDVLNARANPLDHFLAFGAREGRFATASADSALDSDNNNLANEFNSQAYLTANPDLANAVGPGRAFATAYEHFVKFGQFESRPGTPAGGPFTVTGGGVNPGSNLVLTAGADNLVGTNNDDIFLGVNNATTTQLSAVDTIDGLGGQDTLRVELNASYNGGATIRNVETISVTATATDGAAAGNTVFNAAGITGLQTVQNNGSANNAAGGADGLSFTNVGSLANVSVANTSSFTTVTYADAAVAGTADAVTLTLNAVAGNAAVNLNSATDLGAGLETVNVVTTGGASTATLNSNDATISRVNVSGSQNLNLTAGTNVTTSATTINASALTGNLTLQGLGAADHTVTGGAGNDTVLFGANLTAADTFNGGAGTDTLGANAAQLAAFTTRAANISNVETVFIQDDAAGNATINLANFGASNVRIGAQTGGEDIVVNGLASGANVRFDGAVAAAPADLVLNVTNAGLPGTADVLNIDLRGGAVTYAATAAGVETFNIDASNQTGAATLNFTAAAASTFNITNSGAFGVDTGTLGANVSSVNASGVTGSAGVTVSLNGTANTGAAVTGTANADVINGSQLADVINAGAGNDTITAGAGADRINVGAGNDTIVQGAGASGTFAVPGSNTISTATFDIVTGAGAGDRIDLTDVARTVSSVNTLTGVTLADNTATFVRGTYDATANTFVGSATGADSLFVYDADATGTQAQEAVVLVGFTNTATATSDANGVFTLA